MSTEDLLRDATRCLLALRGRRGPLLSPMAVWYDGAGLWATTSAAAVKAGILRRSGRCSVYVPSPRDPEAGGVVVAGDARVFGLHDPLGTLLHAPTISTAMTALAARNAGTILGYAQDAALVPAKWQPRNRVVVRIRVLDAQPVAVPRSAPGIAPALPSVVPPEIRRAVGGRRRVVLAIDDGDLRVAPALWGAAFTLTAAPGVVLPQGARAQAVVDEDLRGRPTQVMGLAVHGVLDGRPGLRAERYTWWTGFHIATVDAPAGGPTGLSAIELPD